MEQKISEYCYRQQGKLFYVNSASATYSIISQLCIYSMCTGLRYKMYFLLQVRKVTGLLSPTPLMWNYQILLRLLPKYILTSTHPLSPYFLHTTSQVKPISLTRTIRIASKAISVILSCPLKSTSTPFARMTCSK